MMKGLVFLTDGMIEVVISYRILIPVTDKEDQDGIEFVTRNGNIYIFKNQNLNSPVFEGDVYIKIDDRLEPTDKVDCVQLIEPCPVCGGEADVWAQSDTLNPNHITTSSELFKWKYYCGCESCGVVQSSDWGEIEAVVYWNTYCERVKNKINKM